MSSTTDVRVLIYEDNNLKMVSQRLMAYLLRHDLIRLTNEKNRELFRMSLHNYFQSKMERLNLNKR